MVVRQRLEVKTMMRGTSMTAKKDLTRREFVAGAGKAALGAMVALGSWTLLHWLVGSIAVLHIDAAATGSQNISSDAFFYGLSPPVYPTRMSYFHAPRILWPSLGAASIQDSVQLDREDHSAPSLGDSTSVGFAANHEQQKVQVQAAGQQLMLKLRPLSHR